MTTNRLLGFALIAVMSITACAQQKATTPSQDNMDSFVDRLLSQMTLEEKLGQLNLPAAGDITTGQAQSSNIADKIRKGEVGGLFNIKGVAKIREVQRVAVEESRLKIPLVFGMDVIHGYQTVFPIPLGLSSSWDMKAIERSAQIAAKESTADGISWTFSPMVDIARDPRWGRVSEGIGEDPYLGSEIAKAFVRGYQGNDYRSDTTMMACVKHFALYGASEAGRDYGTTDMSHHRMYNEYFPPYKAAVDAGVGTVMTSFNEIDGIPASGNKWLMTDVLRKQWGFDGMVVTDYTAINEMIAHGMGDLQTVSALAMNAGVDMDMVGEGFLTTLKKSLDENKVHMESINTAVRRVLEMKYNLGLFNDPYKYCDLSRPARDVYNQANRNEARAIAAESMVLMKNEGGLLPLKRGTKIALVGPLANNNVNMAGTWSVAAEHAKGIPVLQGMQTVGGANTSITYAKGSNLAYDAKFEENATMFGKTLNRDNRDPKVILDEALAIAANADVIVAAVGESAEMSGEASSRSTIDIPDAQKDLLKALKATGKPVVIVLFTGRPLTIKWEYENFPAILNVWFPGGEAGYAIADVLFGEVNPSGKLTSTWPQNVGQIPIFYNHKNTGRPLTGEWFQKFRSNYLDVTNEPQFYFGYGLSYTTFSYGDLRLSKSNLNGNEKLTASIDVSNTGNVDGKEVVQLYIRDLVGSTTRPVQELKGFQKILIRKGETKTISFEITPEDLKFYNYNLDFVWEPGEFDIMIGSSSNQVKVQRINWNK